MPGFERAMLGDGSFPGTGHLRGELDSESGAQRCLTGFEICMAVTAIWLQVATFGPLVPGVDENYPLVSWQVRRRPAGDYSQPMAEQIGR